MTLLYATPRFYNDTYNELDIPERLERDCIQGNPILLGSQCKEAYSPEYPPWAFSIVAQRFLPMVYTAMAARKHKSYRKM